MTGNNQCKLYAAYAKVYCLCNSNGSIFYVGCTVRDLTTRLDGHIIETRSDKSNTAKNKKIKELKYRVFIFELERIWVTCTKAVKAVAKARHREVYWINEMLKQGYDLTNRENTHRGNSDKVNCKINTSSS